MKIGILSEANDNRIAITPEVAKKLIKLNHQLAISSNAGLSADFRDKEYEEAGVKICLEAEIYKNEVVVKINPPTKDEVAKLQANSTLICLLWPAQNKELLESLKAKNITGLSLDCVPRISRAQKMDVLSSMANVAGYRSVVEASHLFGSFLGGQITAAGKIPPAKVLVLGAGVAGLSAIGSASNMGAIVRAFDTRVEVKEQVESMYAQFLEVHIKEEGSNSSGYSKEMSKEFMKAEEELLKKQASEVDIIITTALIPGKPSPVLITKDMVDVMKYGSVIVDLAAERGGNCELTEHTKVIKYNGVDIVGYSDLPSRLPRQSSALFATNMFHLISELTNKDDASFDIDFENEVIRGITVTKDKEITWPAPVVKVSSVPKEAKEEIKIVKKETSKSTKSLISSVLLILTAIGTLYIGSVAPDSFVSHLTVFILSCFIGYQVIWDVSPALHTPLMSVTNAISGVIVLGALVQLNTTNDLSFIAVCFAIFIATINIVGGFTLTQKTLKLFSK